MNHCPTCGTGYQVGSCPNCAPPPAQLVCPRCGASYTGAYCPNGCNSPIAQVPYQQAPPQPPYLASPPPAPKKKHTALIVVLTVVLVLALAAGSGIFFYFQFMQQKPLEEFPVEGKNFLVTSEQFQQNFNQLNPNNQIIGFSDTERDGSRYYVAQLSDKVTLVLLCDPETDYVQMINLQADWDADGNEYGFYIGSVMQLCDSEITEEQASALLTDELEIADPLIGDTKKATHDGLTYTLNASVKSLSFSILPEEGAQESAE